ncbi:tapasin-related protein-like isoform 2-T2 [Symphorus nematophorus]
MGRILKTLIYLYLCAGVQCVHQMSWLPCLFIDERVSKGMWNKTGTTETIETIETERIYREAVLQFGQKGDAPVNPDAITFLVTGSKLDLRRYVEGVEPEQLECELHRYSTPGIHVRWPVKGSKEYNRWFSFTLKHTGGLFNLNGLLRHPTDQVPTGRHDYHNWSVIPDKEILAMTAVMVIKTQTPSVRSGLGAQQKLHCQFAVDHQVPDITVEWHWQHRGERKRLFSHNSRSGQIEGTGVELKSLAGGDASYTHPFTKMSSEGTYVCSVSVNPVFTSVDISLHIEEAPRVSLNVGPTLWLQEGTLMKVVCEARNYYPLDVDISWYKQYPPVSGQDILLPEKLKNVMRSNHKYNNKTKTYSLTASFYIEPFHRDSGRQFTCSVSHPSLPSPIKKKFTLGVEDPTGWTFMLIVMSLAILFFVLLSRSARRKKSWKP